MESPAIGTALLGLFGISALVLVNAYFVASEFALVAVRRTQLELWAADGRTGADSALEAVENLDDAIAATQLGITLASLGLGWVGEPAVAGLLEPLLATVGIGSSAIIHTFALTFAFAAVTFIHVVAGELAPKAIALDYPGRVALVCARPLLSFSRLFRVVLIFMNGTATLLVRALGVRPAGHLRDIHSSEELSLMVSESRAAGVIRPYAGRILGNVFRLTRTRVRDVMVPSQDVIAISKDADSDDLLDLLKGSGFTRIPVYDRDPNQIIGILHTKDLFQIYAKQRIVILSDAIRPAIDMRPDLHVVDALRQFRRNRRHLVIVRDEGGPMLGICTLEDVLEEIVGEIEDEHDVPTAAGIA
jgi:putative hemolysin